MHGWQQMLHSSIPDLIDLSIFTIPAGRIHWFFSPISLLLQKYCWPWGWFGCSFLQLTGLTAPNPYQFEELRLFVVSQRSCQPRRLPAANRTQPCLPEGSRVVVAEEQPLLWQSEASVQTLLSLFTAFTLVQLRSLLQSKCWQAIFINHVRLNVFKCMYLRKNNHALVLFLFSSRPWGFFALFSLAYSVWCKGFSSVWKLVF